ncbi:hypothetical protein N8I74_03365 [Chitiniphilus purpureus]|uniref:FUSC family protein n=1 Tax=Chitiniphilus purpureus TaxID=2981137 RepID=A0ABY6DRG7_9NEIS|nr:hypothetical protein [Chitiniphilus sp. CD1]UXY16076.1 hypothetical protein N8I74_03365 [Chitiniphilus sp. CD1]
MSPRLSAAIRLLLSPGFILAGFIVYGRSLEFLFELIPIPQGSSLVFGALIVQGFLAAAITSILFSHLLAIIYRKSAVVVALAMALPVLVLRFPELPVFNSNAVTIIISSYEIFAYAVLLIAGTWLSQRHLAHSNAAVRRDALPASPLDANSIVVRHGRGKVLKKIIKGFVILAVIYFVGLIFINKNVNQYYEECVNEYNGRVEKTKDVQLIAAELNSCVEKKKTFIDRLMIN